MHTNLYFSVNSQLQSLEHGQLLKEVQKIKKTG